MRYNILLLSLLAASAASAQVTSDALLFSDIHPTITARSLAIGNAHGAIGGDISNLSSNPAGLGFFRTSEFNFSPAFSVNGTRSLFADSLHRDTRSSLQLGNMGLVFAGKPRCSNIQSFGIGMSYNRLASFAQDISLSGTTYGSRLATMAANAQGLQPSNLNPFEDRLAYDAYLIDNPGGGTQYVSALTDSNYVHKSQRIRRSGGISELAMGFGINYKHFLYFGASVGINFLNLRETNTYREVEETGFTSFKEMEMQETRRVEGVGLNARLGLIVRPLRFLRLGLSVSTPTQFFNNERYYTELSGIVEYADTLRNSSYESPDGVYPHRFASPFMATASVGVILGPKDKTKWGFWGFDADYVDYRLVRFGLPMDDELASDGSTIRYIDNLNANVENQLKGAFRLRTGFEFIIGTLRLRLGYRVQSSPYQQAVEGVNDWRHDISGGFGLRYEHFYIDFSYSHSLRQLEHSPYYSATQPQRAIVKSSGGIGMMTVGWRF